MSNFFNDYQDWTDETAIYCQSHSCHNNAMALHAYEALGLTSEIEEFCRATTHDDIIKEAGDILWYLARISMFYGMKFDEAIKNAIKCTRSTGSAITDKRDLFFHAASISDRAKKLLRDWDGSSEDFTAKWEDSAKKIQIPLISLISGVAQFITPEVDDYETTLMMLCQANKKKLSDRKDRSVLTGSGDNR